MEIPAVITSASIPFLGLNWIDILVLIIVIIYAIEGYSLGFILAIIDFISFVFSFLVGIALYSRIAGVLISAFKISQGFANAIAFFLAAVITEIILNLVFRGLIRGLPFFNGNFLTGNIKKVNKVLGIFPGIFSGLLLSSFILSLIVTLPFSVFLKHSVNNSRIGSVLVQNTQSLSRNWNSIFGGAINDALSFLTVEPESDQTVDLHFKVSNTTVDSKAERDMFLIVNKERTSRGLDSLIFSEELARVGRSHCKDMFKRGYFSHYTPDGLSPFDRMLSVKLDFNYAGENLALAPNVNLAMNGLMQSPGHKANILSPNFKRVGIGVIDGGVYGQTYCQEFSD